MEKTIKLNTVAFYKGNEPWKVYLRDCNILANSKSANPPQLENALYTVYGRSYEKMFFPALTQNLSSTNRNFASVALEVPCGDDNFREQITKDNLHNKQIFVIRHISADLLEDLEEKFNLPKGDKNAKFVNDVERQYRLIDALHKNIEQFPNINAFVMHTNYKGIDVPLQIAVIPHQKWAVILNAKCAFDPHISVDCSPPQDGAVLRNKVQQPSIVDSETQIKNQTMKNNGM